MYLLGRCCLKPVNQEKIPGLLSKILPWSEFITSLEEPRFLARKNNFDPLHIITEKYSTLRKYAPRMLSTLQLSASPTAQPLAEVLSIIREIYRKQSRKAPPTAPLEFVPRKLEKSGDDPNGYRSPVLRILRPQRIERGATLRGYLGQRFPALQEF